MELTDKEIERFRRAWLDDFGEAISADFARAELARLLTFLYTLYDAIYGVDRPHGGTGTAACDTMAA